MRTKFEKRLQYVQSSYKDLTIRANKKLDLENGFLNQFQYPVLTPSHIPLSWRYDLNYETNPYLMERFRINSLLNASAIKLNNKYFLIVSVDAMDSTLFLSVAESNNGIDNFEFWDHPLAIPGLDEADINLYDMNIVQHEDGWIYGVFSIDRYDSSDHYDKQPTILIQQAIARTMDLKSWERLPDIKSASKKNYHVSMHPEFINGKYAFHIHPDDNLSRDNNKTGVILCDSITDITIEQEELMVAVSEDDAGIKSAYAAGPAPIKTQYGWLHLVNGIRNDARGPEQVSYMFMTDLKAPSAIIYKPSGNISLPASEDKTVRGLGSIYSNGWIVSDGGLVHIYYSLDHNVHVVTTTVDQLLDYVMNTPHGIPGAIKSLYSLNTIIDNNKALLQLRPAKEKTAK